MNRLRAPAICLALALFSFFWFPGHTWLQQDTQIYVPILEHERDPAVLRNDILVQHPHVAYTLYDEIALGLRTATGLGFRKVLAAQQVAARALGIWGLLMLAEALGLGFAKALTVAAICSLGAAIAGPAVLTVEYEPTPRAFAVPLLVCAMGLAARGRDLAASIATGAAFLYHPPTTLPVLAASVLLIRRVRPVVFAPLAAAVLIVMLAARGEGQQAFFASVTPQQEILERMRTAYCWISTWPAATIAQHVLMFGVLVTACARLRLGFQWLVLPLIGLLSMPLSWLLLEHWKWNLMPQLQPMRALLFVTLGMQFAAAVAAMKAPTKWEAAAWIAIAIVPSVQIAAVGYPRLHTSELTQLSEWARANTSQDAVFLFPDSGRSLAPGVFRSDALRAVYVDWKGGGQMNYIQGFGAEWWNRWQQRVAAAKNPGLGVNYIVLRKRNSQAPVFENASYAVYRSP
jgi:hypothetical protein